MVLRVSVAPLGHAVADRALWYVQQEKKDLKKSGSLSLQASGEREGGGKAGGADSSSTCLLVVVVRVDGCRRGWTVRMRT